MNIIKVTNLTKSFQIYKKSPGLIRSLASFFNRKEETITAVDNISFEIQEGELVGFIGPNGAGKTTTLKCLSGLLYPTKGDINVLGYKPFERQDKYLTQISLIMGQKNQLWWDLPAMETLILNKEIYNITDKVFNQTLNELTELLFIRHLMDIPVRKLSLGERMKMELVAALIHRPKILFLDEPTIGLDVVMQKNMRDFIKKYNKKYKTTILLTSHYMHDVKELCKRIVIINKGKLLYDGSLEIFIRKRANKKIITITLNNRPEKSQLIKIKYRYKYDFPKIIFEVPRPKAKDKVIEIIRNFPDVEDLNVEEPEIDDIIRDYFINKK